MPLVVPTPGEYNPLEPSDQNYVSATIRGTVVRSPDFTLLFAMVALILRETRLHREYRTTMQRPVLFHIEHRIAPIDLENRVAWAVAAGFDGVELSLSSTSSGPQNDTPTDVQQVSAGANAIEERFRTAPQGEARRRIRAIAWRCTTCDLPTALLEVTDFLVRAGEMGARVLNLTIPSLGCEQQNASFASYQEALNFAYKLLQELRFEAEATGVSIALEPAIGRCLLSPVELREIIDCANSWAVGVCIDTLRVARIGCPHDWLMTLNSRVHAVRINRDEPGGSIRRGEPGSASNLSSIAETLDRIKYDGIIITAGEHDPATLRTYLSTLAGADARTCSEPVQDAS